VVAMLGGVFSLPTIILARIFLKEKVTLAQTAGSLVVIAGIILLSLL
jgi:drug/metabolite transporter (DMT)-like permease